MNRRILESIFAVLMMATLSQPASAIDTDIFISQGSENKPAPNVLFMFDNAANWTQTLTQQVPDLDGKTNNNRTFQANIVQALHLVLSCLNLGTGPGEINLNVGIMGISKSTPGGKVHKAIQNLDNGYRDNLFEYLYEQNGKNVEDWFEGGEPDSVPECLQADYFEKDEPGTFFEDHSGTGGGDDPNIPIEKQTSSLIATMLHEAYLYFAGKAPRGSLSDQSNSNKTDTDDFFDDDSLLDAGDPDSLFASPMTGDNECGDNYIIYIGGANDPNNAAGDADAKDLLTALGGNTQQIDIPGLKANDNLEQNFSDEYTRFLASTDVNDQIDGKQSIRTYVIDAFDPDNLNAASDQLRRPYMRSIAESGDGKYFAAANAAEVARALATILTEIVAVDSVFASAALPVSVNVRGTNLNQVYMGVFRPDSDNKPLWAGNLKAFKLGISAAGNLQLQDVNGVAAENTDDGFLGNEITSYWSGTSSYWDFAPNGFGQASDAPDGQLVEKGGIGQAMRSGTISSRKVYTCVGCSAGTSLSSNLFDTSLDATSKAALCDAYDLDGLLAAAAVAEVSAGSNRCSFSPITEHAGANNMINWLRGQDVLDARSGNGSAGTGNTTEARPYLHGDVLHSRPTVVNYNRERNDSAVCDDDLFASEADRCDDVVVFYGTNSGTLVAAQGGLDTDQGGNLPTPGTELWSFIAPEFFPKLGQLYDNETLLADDPSAPATTIKRNIYFDGDLEVIVNDANDDQRIVASDGDSVILIASMRRGGDMLYALDVSDPDDPKFLWKKRGPVSAGSLVPEPGGDYYEQIALTGDPGFGEFGQSWSRPTITYLKGVDVNNDTVFDSTDLSTPVVILGKGYSPLSDDIDGGTSNDLIETRLDVGGDRDIGIGTGIMILNALTGEPIWQVGPNSLADTRGIVPLPLPLDPKDAAVLTLLDLPSGSEYRYEADMVHSVPAAVTIVDRGIDGTGGDDDDYADFAFFGDTGGQLWKVDLRAAFFGQVSKIAEIGGTGANNRRFLFPPSVVTGRIGSNELPYDSCGAFDAILIGSGNREDPFGTAIDDRFYMFKDHYFPNNKLNTDRCSTTDITPDVYTRQEAVGYRFPSEYTTDPSTTGSDLVFNQYSELGAAYTENDLYDVTNNTLQESENTMNAIRASDPTGYETDSDYIAAKAAYEAALAGLDEANGWYIQLDNGEKVVSSSRTFAGAVFFNSNVPATEVVGCGGSLGEARTYAIDFITAGAKFNNDNTGDTDINDRYLPLEPGGFPPDPVHVVVMTDDGRVVEGTCIGPHCQAIPGTVFNQRMPIYWYQDIDEAQ